MKAEPFDALGQPGGLVHLLSAPEGSLFWAAGMRHEIQTSIDQATVDYDYVGQCLTQLLRSGGWRLLQNISGRPFTSFLQFCYASRPHGLGLCRSELEKLLQD